MDIYITIIAANILYAEYIIMVIIIYLFLFCFFLPAVFPEATSYLYVRVVVKNNEKKLKKKTQTH